MYSKITKDKMHSWLQITLSESKVTGINNIDRNVEVFLTK